MVTNALPQGKFMSIFLFTIKSFFQRHIKTHLLACEDGTECSETSAFKTQTPGNYPKEIIQQIKTLLQFWSCHSWLTIFTALILQLGLYFCNPSTEFHFTSSIIFGASVSYICFLYFITTIGNLMEENKGKYQLCVDLLSLWTIRSWRIITFFDVMLYYKGIFSKAQQPLSEPRPPHYGGSTITLRHTTLVRTPLE
jgi:hypothetical protein